ncbi:MAG: hypothetical protein ACQESV_04420 [Thermodesulfobacteriota bacterium]
MRNRILIGLVCGLLVAFAVPAAVVPAAAEGPPGGALQRLVVEHGSSVYQFGPFVGYYFQPVQGRDLTRLKFWCYNENQFYTQDRPEGELLFTGEAVFTCLPDSAPYQPEQDRRMRPVFAEDIPEEWQATRPEPRDEFTHFHSCYDAVGAVACGYWVRHEAQSAFTYDMGGRVGSSSPLYHEVKPGVDRDFPNIVEFDTGP